MTVINMDCREGMATMIAADSIDAIVTDPPYGLSKQPDMAEVLRHWLAGDDYSGSPRQGRSNCASEIVKRNSIVDSKNTDPETVQKSVSFRVDIDFSPVSVRVVEFDNGGLLWEVEIDTDKPERGFKNLLMDEGYASTLQKIADGQFRLREAQSFSGCVGSCACCAKSTSPRNAVLVRFCNDSFRESERTPEVMAFLATEMVFVLSFNVADRSAKLSPAAGASKIDGIFSLTRPEFIGTFSAASGLSPVAEPGRIGGVAHTTDGTISFNLATHEKLLDRLENPRIVQNGFMGKSWDSFVPGPATWREAFRCLKPGGWAVVFAGSRTQDLMSVSLRLAGFEVMDVGQWLYGSGFPKSLDISKAIDKAAGAEREVIGVRATGIGTGNGTTAFTGDGNRDITDAAKQWDGWGTALKPGYEPFILCRKPLDGTYANNVLKHGVGALNIDGCRSEDRERTGYGLSNSKRSHGGVYGTPSESADFDASKGRWPANVVTTDLDEPWAKYFYHAKASKADRDEGLEHLGVTDSATLVDRTADSDGMNSPRAGAGRTSGRRNIHPTVKPTALMQWLCRLVTPPGGTVLDPFTGSGSTGKAAMLEGFNFIGFELDPQYAEIAHARIDHARNSR